MGNGVPDYPVLPTHFKDPAVKVEKTLGQGHSMTGTLNSQFAQTTLITLDTFQDTMGPDRLDRTRKIIDMQASKPGYSYNKKVDPVNPNQTRPEHLNKHSQVLLNDPKIHKKHIHYLHTEQKPTHNTKYNHARKAYDLGEKKKVEDWYHTARRTPLQATAQGRDDLAQRYRVIGTEHAIASGPKMEQIVNLRGGGEGWRPMAERVIKNEDWIRKEGDRMRREFPKNGHFGF